jgi:putative hydrolase
MLKIDLHVHTVNSGHGFATMYEMLAEAKRKGMTLVGFADHGPAMPKGGSVEYFVQGYRMPKAVNGVRALLGTEANILDAEGTLDLVDRHLALLKPVIAGMHSIAGYKETDIKQNTKAFINVLKNPLVHMISHPVSPRHAVDIHEVALTACKHNKLLELNNSYFNGTRLGEKELELAREMVTTVRGEGHKLIINSDAHFLHELGDDSGVMAYAKRIGLKKTDIINNYPEELKACLSIE